MEEMRNEIIGRSEIKGRGFFIGNHRYWSRFSILVGAPLRPRFARRSPRAKQRAKSRTSGLRKDAS
jgi:hypothetical protein